MTLFEESISNLQTIKSKRNPNNFNIIFFGDSWVNSGVVSDNIFEVAMLKAMDFNPLLFVHGGDAVFTGTAANLEAFVTKVNTLNKDKEGNSVPFFLVPGNHDAAKTGNILSLDNYRQIIGPPEIHWAVDLPEFNLKLIGLNTLYNYVYNEYGLTESELNFLENSLLNENHFKNIFVAMHVPPREPQLQWVGSDAFPDERGRTEFYRIVKDKVSRVLVSHIHDFQLAKAQGVRFILSGGGGATLNVGALNHIVVINIRNYGLFNIVTPKFVPVGWTRASEPVSP
ncbi:MAG: metallophosphoesterase [Bacillota bacterium]|nr:metallophosphoesterase [Bacillota bacterium]